MITSLPDVLHLEIDPARDKFMVLACDGIWNFMSSQEVCDYVSERLSSSNYAKLSQIVEELFMHCLAPDSDGDGTGCDNMTCVLVTFEPYRQVTVRSGVPSLLVAQNVNTTSEAAANQNGSDKVGCLKRTLETNSTEDLSVESKMKPLVASANVNDENSLNGNGINGSKKLKSSDDVNMIDTVVNGNTIETDHN